MVQATEADGSAGGAQGVPRMDLCIANFYTEQGRMGLHQDKHESKAARRQRVGTPDKPSALLPGTFAVSYSLPLMSSVDRRWIDSTLAVDGRMVGRGSPESLPHRRCCVGGCAPGTPFVRHERLRQPWPRLHGRVALGATATSSNQAITRAR